MNAQRMAVSSIALVELDSEADKIERGRHLHADDFFLEIKASRGVDLKLGVERFEGCRFGKAVTLSPSAGTLFLEISPDPWPGSLPNQALKNIQVASKKGH